MKRFLSFVKKQSAARLIAFGFLAVILAGTLLLLLPISVRDGVSLNFLDALFTATSATCVTGLVVVDTYDTFSVFGRVVIAVLMQAGGLGVSSIGIGLMVAAGRKIGFKSRLLAKEALNVDSFSGIIRLVKSILLLTLGFELLGALLSFCVFVRDYPLATAAGVSIFHSIAAFNNAGFDVMGGFSSLSAYRGNIALNLITCMLIILGGIGFPQMLDIAKKKSFKKLTLQTKAVLSTTAALITGGALLIYFTEDVGALSAFFTSVTARTAGFSTFDMGSLSNAGIIVVCLLMFVGASPGSTGGGVKTTTFFALTQSLRSAVQNHRYSSFRRTIPATDIHQAYLLVLIGLMSIFTGTFLICALEPGFTLSQVLFEVVSAYSTTGLSTGITTGLCSASRVVIIILMYFGRIGGFTLISVWAVRTKPDIRYTKESITIG